MPFRDEETGSERLYKFLHRVCSFVFRKKETREQGAPEGEGERESLDSMPGGVRRA